MPVQYGGSAQASQRFVQTFSLPSSQWTVIHNFGFFPNVIVFDGDGNEIAADVQYTDDNTVVVTWPSPTTGKVVVS